MLGYHYFSFQSQNFCQICFFNVSPFLTYIQHFLCPRSFLWKPQWRRGTFDRISRKRLRENSPLKSRRWPILFCFWQFVWGTSYHFYVCFTGLIIFFIDQLTFNIDHFCWSYSLLINLSLIIFVPTNYWWQKFHRQVSETHFG